MFSYFELTTSQEVSQLPIKISMETFKRATSYLAKSHYVCDKHYLMEAPVEDVERFLYCLCVDECNMVRISDIRGNVQVRPLSDLPVLAKSHLLISVGLVHPKEIQRTLGNTLYIEDSHVRNALLNKYTKRMGVGNVCRGTIPIIANLPDGFVAEFVGIVKQYLDKSLSLGFTDETFSCDKLNDMLRQYREKKLSNMRWKELTYYNTYDLLMALSREMCKFPLKHIHILNNLIFQIKYIWCSATG